MRRQEELEKKSRRVTPAVKWREMSGRETEICGWALDIFTQFDHVASYPVYDGEENAAKLV